MLTIKCVCCHQEQDLTEFRGPKSSKCRSCRRQKNQKQRKKKYLENREKIAAFKKTEEGKTLKRKHDRDYYMAHRDEIRSKRRAYNELYKNRRNELQRGRIKTDPHYRLNKNIRRGIYFSLFGNKGRRHWEDLVGYTLKELTQHIESQFTDGMNWKNYGEGEGKWVIDHIIPIGFYRIFSYDCDEFRKCWSLTNLRPLWYMDNARKSKEDAIIIRKTFE